ncbi:MAG TPA: adventurous gliding motility protein CglE [Myxococcales bacterium]|nr:adventurous gliding motility protein CglE [Myxococcales bacterium]
MHTTRISAAALFLAIGGLLAARPASAEQLDLSSISSNGSPEPVRTGFFVETSLGTFFTLGGNDGYSNVEAFLGIGVGYDILKELSVSLQFQLAPSAGDCYIAVDGNDDCGAGGEGSSTFTMAALDLEVSYRVPILDRLFIPIRAFGGMADLSPLPRCDLVSNGCSANSNPPGDVWEPSFGLATGIEYATHFDHFTIGLEGSARYVAPGALNMLAIAIYPRIKYTF